MVCDDQGYWHAALDDVQPQTRYVYRLDGKLDRPDPASMYQPLGVHKESAIVDHAAFTWHDRQWTGIEQAKMVIYELHIGTFTREGTFEAATARLDYLCDLGINAVEIMPVSQFPGDRNWGYDGVHPFCVQNSYGGPDGLKCFVDKCHEKGISTILDVVYNHLGPEGNYFRDFGPYFTNRYKTPWGDAINYDGEYSNHVREFFIQNALYWFEHFHIDALRLDAVHAMYDSSALHFLTELSQRVAAFSKQCGRERYCIAESDLNDPCLVRPEKCGGYGLCGQWSDDFHHALHGLLTNEKRGYYADFGSIDQLAKAIDQGYVYTGQYSDFRKRNHGAQNLDVPPCRFVVCSQNHDQIGNRALGERLATLVSFENRKLAAAAVLLSPQVPLLFMGEEWGEHAPFLYFVSHGDAGLADAVRRGRGEEFKDFLDEKELPDPSAEKTFLASKLSWDNRDTMQEMLLAWYKHCIGLRAKMGDAICERTSYFVQVIDNTSCISLVRTYAHCTWHVVFNFGATDVKVTVAGNGWKKVLDSSGKTWGGSEGEAHETIMTDHMVKVSKSSVSVYERNDESRPL